jgi:hypothetical protein
MNALSKYVWVTLICLALVAIGVLQSMIDLGPLAAFYKRYPYLIGNLTIIAATWFTVNLFQRKNDLLPEGERETGLAASAETGILICIGIGLIIVYSIAVFCIL